MNLVRGVRLGKVSSFLRPKSFFSTFVETLPSVSLADDKAKYFLTGNPLIYDKIVASVGGSPGIGDEISVKDIKGKVIGRGFFNPLSMYRVRLTALKNEKVFDMPLHQLIKSRIDSAIKLRQLIQLPSDSTNVYRLVNGEGDKLSGLIIDILGDTIVVQSSAVWVEKHSESVKQALQAVIEKNNFKLLWRQSEANLKKDGYEEYATANKIALKTGSTETTVEWEHEQTVHENGLKYHINPHSDQKTGFYCDQRENRLLVRGLVKDKTVLDTCCYTGGFALNALAGGATHVTCVDSSNTALVTAQANVALNNFETDRVTLIEGDCEAVMKQLISHKKHYNVVICDPPKLAPTRGSVKNASKKYANINTLGMQLVDPSGGLMLTCTCSAAMTQSENNEFMNMIALAAKYANRNVTILSVSGAGPDHPVLPAYQEGRYLTSVLMYVESGEI